MSGSSVGRSVRNRSALRLISASRADRPLRVGSEHGEASTTWRQEVGRGAWPVDVVIGSQQVLLLAQLQLRYPAQLARVARNVLLR